ncbi:4726_t:CDS:2 [Diversispora eburnea]|uniref:4726_t:CDS:1 n=1 Tax=Diversispora eburnea TaxID=1213867 RepID=A0A9N8UWY3_9GLOM|nr:4726_t:CDS:2 [Diversispora eburnea]
MQNKEEQESLRIMICIDQIMVTSCSDQFYQLLQRSLVVLHSPKNVVLKHTIKETLQRQTWHNLINKISIRKE